MLDVPLLFQEVEDPRRSNATLHDLHEMLTVALLSTLCGGESCVDMELFGRSKGRFLRGGAHLDRVWRRWARSRRFACHRAGGDEGDALLRHGRRAVGGALRARPALALVDRERGRNASDRSHWVLDVTMNEDGQRKPQGERAAQPGGAAAHGPEPGPRRVLEGLDARQAQAGRLAGRLPPRPDLRRRPDRPRFKCDCPSYRRVAATTRTFPVYADALLSTHTPRAQSDAPLSPVPRTPISRSEDPTAAPSVAGAHVVPLQRLRGTMASGARSSRP